MIRVFDTASPGRQEENRPTCRTRKSRAGGIQRGLISSLACLPDDPSLLAAGSYEGSVAIYDLRVMVRMEEGRERYTEREGERDLDILACIPIAFVGGQVSPSEGAVSLLQGHQGGVTRLRVAPDGRCLFSGARKDPCIYAWDLRNVGQVRRKGGATRLLVSDRGLSLWYRMR
jgi:WD40 repeat protein